MELSSQKQLAFVKIRLFAKAFYYEYFNLKLFLVAVQRFSFHSYKAPLDSKNLAPHRYKCYSKSLLTDINGSKPFSFVSSFFFRARK